MSAKLQTIEHIERVQSLLWDCLTRLFKRALDHDKSKLESPEAEIFEEYTHKLKGVTYGSDEYRQFLAEMKPALDHHYAANRHHPEHFRWLCPVCNRVFTDVEWEAAPQGPNDSGDRYCPACCRHGMLYESQLVDSPQTGLNGMTLLDLLEMFVDWKAASERHADGCIHRSIEQNISRFGLSPQLAGILRNTAAELWPDVKPRSNR